MTTIISGSGDICLVCKSRIELDHERILVKNGSICMRCEGASIDAWRITITGEKGGYCELDPTDIIDMIEEMTSGDSYTIKKSKMAAVEYHNLPEFQGF